MKENLAIKLISKLLKFTNNALFENPDKKNIKSCLNTKDVKAFRTTNTSISRIARGGSSEFVN